MNHDPLTKNLHTLQDTVSLTKSEKASFRTQLVMQMAAKPLAPVVSPYTLLFGAPMRYALVLFIMFGVTGGTVAASADARPGDALYAVKLRVAEPMRVALAKDLKKKGELRLSFAEARLKEIVESADSTLDAGTEAMIAASLTEHVDGAADAIAALQQDGEAGDAYLANQKLQTVLKVHADVLVKVAREKPATSGIVAITAQLQDRGAQAQAAEEPLLFAVSTQAEAAGIAAPLDAVQADMLDELAELSRKVEGASEKLDESDRKTVSELLSKVEALSSQARAAQGAGSQGEALALFAKANSYALELRTRVDLERTLDIDLIDDEILD